MPILETLTRAFKARAAPPRLPLARRYSASPWLFSSAEDAAAQPFNYSRDVARAYADNPIAQRAVRLVSESIGNAPLSAADPAPLALINTTSAGQSLLETLAAHLLLHGNGYIQILSDPATGTPLELYALRPDRVTIIPDSAGWPVAFDYRADGEAAVRIPAGDDLGRPQLIHIRSFHPSDDHYGMGCLAAAREAVAIHNAAARWNRSLLDNAARPCGAVVFDPGEAGASLTADQFDRLSDELARGFAGAANAGRPMILEGGLKWQPLSLSPADMDFAGLKAAAARDIALAFGVPPMLLGLPGDATYANYREANKALWRLTLLPMATKLLSALAEGLAPWWPGLALSVDLDRLPALSEDRERLWSQVSGADFLSDEEKRSLLGLSARPAPQPDITPDIAKDGKNK